MFSLFGFTISRNQNPHDVFMKLKSLVRDDAVIFDVGAHKGETTSKFIDIFKAPKNFFF